MVSAAVSFYQSLLQPSLTVLDPPPLTSLNCKLYDFGKHVQLALVRVPEIQSAYVNNALAIYRLQENL
jgi:hypothetical protein